MGIVSRGVLGAFLPLSSFVAVAIASALVAPGCGDYGPVTLAVPPEAGTLGTQAGRGVGAACSAGEPCRAGLACVSGVCAPGRSLDEGAACLISAECKEGLHCGADRKCRPSGRAAVGETCASEADCASGARCNPVGLSAECAAEGAADVGGACKTSAECFGGLLCGAGTCASPQASKAAMPLALPSFAGVACEDETSAPPRAHFRVPRGKDDGDFFRLPFPSDVRRKSGRLDLAGFPTPGADVLGFDLVDRWRTFVEANVDGFSPYSSVVLRFAGAIDFDTFKSPGTIRFVDLTANTDVGFSWSSTTGRSPYVCGTSMTLRPTVGEPLAQGHTFAVLVSNAAKAKGGGAIEVSPDLKALVAAGDPGAPLSEAWASFSPLRAWAGATAYDLGAVVTATVFTTSKAQDLAEKTAALVASSPPPPVTGWVKCGVAPSPCADATLDRACPTAQDPAFDELHALVSLPVLQKGAPPYRASPTDGDVVLGADGTPAVQTRENVCLSLTIPKNAVMPAGGWPLVVYAHDTGDSFRSHVTRGLAKRFAAADSGAAAVAVLGFEQVGHGTRKPAAVNAIASAMPTWSPSAMRGVSVQAAADVLAMVRLARTLDVPAGTSPTSNAFRFGKAILVGHGRGAAAVAVAAPRTDAEGVVLAGHGGSFLDLVPTKVRAVDFASVAPVVLAESPLSASSPVLTLFQTAVDATDPLSHAEALAVSGATAKRHAFMVYGLSDSHTPAVTQVAYALAAGLGVAAPPSDVTGSEPIRATTLPVPAGGNVAAGTYTAVVRQYTAPGEDGHVVLFRDADAVKDVDGFVADVARGVVPTVGR